MRPQEDNKPSAFILFVQEWRKLRSTSLNWELCVHLAGPAWKNMTLEDRQPYIHKARQLRTNGTAKEIPIAKEAIDAVGHEQEIRYMQQQIEKLVRNSVEQKELETCNYYFVMVNCFAKDACAPAELAAAQFSLQGGVQNVYHTLVNPGSAVYGSLEAQEYASATHQLPVPPNALGNEDFGAVLADFMDFVRAESVFTLQDQLPIVGRALKFLNGGVSSQLNVYPIEYLFYIMKQAACQAATLPLPESVHITNAQFKLDQHELLADISCEFHQQRDLPKHCAKSLVTRWGFKFAENLCSDLKIVMRPTRHMPGNSHRHLITEAPEAELNPSDDKEEASNETPIKVEPMIDEDQFNPDVLDALNSLDLDNIFDEEDFLESDTSINVQPETEDMQAEDSPEDGEISSDVEISSDIEIDKIPLPPSPSCIVDISDESRPDVGTNGHMKSVERFRKFMKATGHVNQTRSISPKSSKESDSSEKIHRTRLGSPSLARNNRWRSRSRSRSRDNRCFISISRKTHYGEHRRSSSNNRSISPTSRFGFHKVSHDRSISSKRTRRDHTRLRRSSSISPIRRSRERVSRMNHSNSPRRSQKRVSPIRTRGDHSRFRRSSSVSPIRRSRERVSRMNHSNSPRRSQKECVSPTRKRRDHTRLRRSSSISPIQRSRERVSRVRLSNSPRCSQKERVSPKRTRRDHTRWCRSPSYTPIRRSRERVSRVNPSNSPRRSQKESVSPKRTRRDHTRWCRSPSYTSIRRSAERVSPVRLSNSPRRSHKESVSPKRTRRDYTRWCRSPSYTPIRRSAERVSRVRLSNSPRRSQKESDSPKRTRRVHTRWCRSPSYSPIRRSGERVSRLSPSDPTRRSPYYERLSNSPEILNRSNGKDLRIGIYSRDRSSMDNIVETTEKNLMPTPNIILPNDTLRESHPESIGNRKSISTIITESSGRVERLREKSHQKPASIPTLISRTTHHYESIQTYKKGYQPRTCYEHNGHDQPILGPLDLRHRLIISRSNYFSSTDLRHRIQEREYFLPQSQTVSYSQEQFLDYGNSRPAWESYHLSQWHNGSDDFLSNTYY